MDIFVDNNLIRDAVDAYSDTILRIAFNYTQNKADAEDIVQEVFLTLLKQQSFRSFEHLKAWLIRVAINKSRELYRSAKRKETVALDAAYPVQYNFDSEDAGIMSQIRKLPEKDRNIVYLFYFEGYPAKEIAGITNMKEAAIFTRLKRIRAKLKDLIE